MVLLAEQKSGKVRLKQGKGLAASGRQTLLTFVFAIHASQSTWYVTVSYRDCPDAGTFQSEESAEFPLDGNKVATHPISGQVHCPSYLASVESCPPVSLNGSPIFTPLEYRLERPIIGLPAIASEKKLELSRQIWRSRAPQNIQ